VLNGFAPVVAACNRCFAANAAAAFAASSISLSLAASSSASLISISSLNRSACFSASSRASFLSSSFCTMLAEAPVADSGAGFGFSGGGGFEGSSLRPKLNKDARDIRHNRRNVTAQWP